MEKIKNISVILVAMVILVLSGWFLADKYFTTNTKIDSVINFLNTQIAASQKAVTPVTK